MSAIISHDTVGLDYQCTEFINKLILTFTNKLVHSINTKTLVNITVGVFRHGNETSNSIIFIVNSNDCLADEFIGQALMS